MKHLTDNDLKEIKRRLTGKRIFLISYCHADHAWLNSRDWHVRRYQAVIEHALEMLEEYPGFKYFIDSWSELLAPVLERRPDLIPPLQRMLREGRLALCGHWSNIRYSHIADESQIRNLIHGRRKIKEIFPEARLDLEASLDVGIGHSQVPQILKLGGCDNYMAWRPLKGLDSQEVPRMFLWEGLSGDQVTVGRQSYQGWFHAEEFYDKKGDACDFDNREMQFDFIVRYAWEHFLKEAATQPGLQTLYFNQGGDDQMPHIDGYGGFERDLFAVIDQWNAEGFGYIQYGTPHDIFDSTKEAVLPHWRGVLDPAEVCYNMARNGKAGIWWLRELGDRALVSAEKYATLAWQAGKMDYPVDSCKRLWENLLTYCTHALEFIFKQDFDQAALVLQNVIVEAGNIQTSALAALVEDGAKNDPDIFTVFNPLPEKRREIVLLDIPNVYNDRKSFRLVSEEGIDLPMQVVHSGGLERFFHVLCELNLPAGGAGEVHVGWAPKPFPLCREAEDKGLSMEVSSDSIRLVFRNGFLLQAENLKCGAAVRSTADNAIMDPVRLEQNMGYWMADSFADNPDPFVPETLKLIEEGPLRWRVLRKGRCGTHAFKQFFDLYRGKNHVEVTTLADVVADSACVALSMPMEENAELTVDIPFGVEERELSAIEYGFMGGGNYENIERRIPGIFWARSWTLARGENSAYAMLSLDGPRYFRRYGTPQRLLHLLACVNPDRDTGWLPFTHSQLPCGRNTFVHRLVIGNPELEAGEVIRLSGQGRTELPVVPGRKPQCDFGMELSPESVRLSAFYRDGARIMLRVVNLAPSGVIAEIELPLKPTRATRVNFAGESISDGTIELNKNEIRFQMRPWQISTVALEPPSSRARESVAD